MEYPQKQMNLNTFQMNTIIILNGEEKIKWLWNWAARIQTQKQKLMVKKYSVWLVIYF